jgi:hypothetical protein
MREDGEMDDRMATMSSNSDGSTSSDGDGDDHSQASEYLRRSAYIDVDLTCVLFVRDADGESIGEGDIRLPRVRLSLKRDHDYDSSLCDDIMMDEEEEGDYSTAGSTDSEDNSHSSNEGEKESVLSKVVRRVSAWMNAV